MEWALWLSLVSVFSLLAGALLVLFWMVPRLERLFLFRPVREVLRTPADAGIPFEQCFIDTPDGCRLSAWHLSPDSPQGEIIYFHGNGGNLGLLVEVLELFYRHGLRVLAVDYRGYGWSTGFPTEKGLYGDALAVVAYFRRHFHDPQLPLLYWGRSLGGSVAAFAAGRHSPDGLILETAFSSKASLLRFYPHFRPFYPFSRCRFETARHLEGHFFPVMLLHGDRDRTVPLEEGRRLYEMITGPKQFHCIEGADHINLHRLDSEAYMGRVLEFVRRVRPSLVQ